eukprot:350415-Chlamydomonas_euryale.AAC.14
MGKHVCKRCSLCLVIRRRKGGCSPSLSTFKQPRGTQRCLNPSVPCSLRRTNWHTRSRRRVPPPCCPSPAGLYAFLALKQPTATHRRLCSASSHFPQARSAEQYRDDDPPPPTPSVAFLFQVSMAFKNQQVLKDISWEVKKGERVGLVGVNGAGKTTQLQIIMGKLAPDGGNVVKAKKNMCVCAVAGAAAVVWAERRGGHSLARRRRR